MKKHALTTLGFLSMAMVGNAQIPDLLNALDAGSRSLGAGGAFNVTGADTLSILNNPAGLGYISTKSYGLAYRTLPKTATSLSGSIATPNQATNDVRGSNQLSHLGYVTPLKNGQTFGISYQIGGFISDERTGTGMTSGALTNISYAENIESRTDFYTLSLGKANESGTSSIGYGLVLANTSFSDRQFAFQPGQTPTVILDSNINSSGTGVGLVVGRQWSSANNPNTSYGASLRTPIKLNGSITDSYSTIPGQFSIGFATRKDNFQGEGNTLVFGAQGSYFFGGSADTVLNRTNQTVLGFGAEWNRNSGDYDLPIRIGYATVGAGGDGFARRNVFTYGIGYHPKTQPWAVDLNYALPSVGGRDFALLISYRFDR